MTTLYTYYAFCECNVWPLLAHVKVGRCKRCKVRPQGFYDNRDDALDAMHAELGRGPAPWV